MRTNVQIADELRFERNQLNDKFVKLVNFINSSKFTDLPLDHQTLLVIQQNAMSAYINVLAARIYNLVGGA